MHDVADGPAVRDRAPGQGVIGRGHHVPAAREPFREIRAPSPGGKVAVAVQDERMGSQGAAREPHGGDERPPLPGMRAVAGVIRA